MPTNWDLDNVSAQVQRIREALLQRHEIYDEDSVPAEEERAVNIAARHARVNAHWGLTSEIPVVGPVIVLARRALRIGLRWYINPIVEQQNQFNDSVVRALNQLEADIERLKQTRDQSA